MIIKPMLAFPFKHSKASFPNFAQPKLDGIRGVWYRDEMHSRGLPKETGKVWNEGTISHIVKELKQLQKCLGMSLALDGEMYCHGMSLQKINSRCAVNRVDKHEDVESVKYYVFDTISLVQFSGRNEVLNVLREHVKMLQLQHIVIVETHLVGSYHEFEMYHKFNLSRGFEGTMYREGKSSYGFLEHCGNQENRWNYLLKRKNAVDMDCVIIDVLEGRMGETGQMLGKAGALKVKAPSGVVFNVGTGLVVAHRKFIWDNKESFIGVNVRILYEELSDQGKPLRARIECIDDHRLV